MMQVTSWWMMVVLVYWVSPSRALLLATPSPSNAISSAFTKQQTTRNNFPLAMISNRDSMRSSDVAMMQKSSISRDFARSSSRTKLQLASTSSSNISPKSSSSDENLPNYDFTNEDDVKQWLVGCKLYSLYKGFKMERAEVMIYLDHGKTEQDFITKFDGTITSYEDGLFRITRDDENTNRYEYKIEMIHVVRPDVCFYFDLDEKFIKWTGTLNMQTKTITNGIVTTNKKRFGIIPYVEELATFETIEIFDRLTEVPKHRRVYNIGHIPLEVSYHSQTSSPSPSPSPFVTNPTALMC